MEQLQKLTKNKSNRSNETYGSNGTYRTYKSYRTNVTYAVLFVLLCSFFVTPQKIAKAGILSRPPTNLGLVGYWPMDEGAGNKVIDASGQGNTGTITGATWTNGKHGKALSFNGGSDNVKSANTNFITATNQSWSGSAWIYPTSNSSYQAVWSYGEFNDNAASAGFGIGTNGNLFWYWNGVLGVHDSGLLVPLNRWSFVSVVRNPTTIDFNVNGQVSTVGEANAVGMDIGNPHQIGYSSRNQIQEGYFSGRIDDVRLYNRALTASEVSKLYTSGGVRTKSGPSLVQTGTCLIGGNTCTINITNNAGNLLWVGINDYANTVDGWVYSISDTKGNSYLTASPATDTGNVNAPQTIQTFYAVNVPAGANTITCSRGAHNGGSARCTVLEYSGLATVSPFDGHLESTVSGTNYTSGTLTTTNANDLLIGYFASRLDQSWSGLSWTSRFQNNIDFGVLVQDKLISSKGAYSVSATASNSAAGVIATNAFKSASGSTKMNSSQNNKLTNGLVGLWSFNGPDYNSASTTAEVLDRSGQGNNANNSGGTVTQGKVGQALSFDGVDDYVDAGDPYNFGTGDFSVSAWVYATNVTNFKPIIAFYDIGGNRGWEIEDIGALNWIDFVTSSNQRARSTMMTRNTWHHVVAIRNGSTMSMYVDGVKGSDTTASDNVDTQTNSKLSFGGWNYSWSGKIDEVRIYNRALSADEVKQLYNMGK